MERRPAVAGARRRRRRIAITLVALLAGPFLAEGLLRWMLFSDSSLARRLGAEYRDAGLYVAASAIDEYYLLLWKLDPEKGLPLPGVPHRELGWVRTDLDPETLRHRSEDRLAGRRPVLLFGSSFAACVNSEVKFPELLERSELGSSHRILDYSTSGYGIDQSLLLLRRALDHYARLDPLVVFSFVVESDLKRVALPFYCAPKPYFALTSDGPELILPETLDPKRFAELHPLPIQSYLMRYMVHGLDLFPATFKSWYAGEQERTNRIRALAVQLLTQVDRESKQRNVPYFFLILHGKENMGLDPERAEDDRRLIDWLDRMDLPYVDAREETDAAQRRGIRAQDFFDAGEGSDERHPNELGTRVLFDSILRGLRR